MQTTEEHTKTCQYHGFGGVPHPGYLTSATHYIWKENNSLCDKEREGAIQKNP